MDTCLGETQPVTNIGSTEPSEWVRHTITLLDAALRKLGDKDPAAQYTILEATHFLQKQINLHPAPAVPAGTGRLLTWQARKVREHIDAHITDRLLVAELGTLIGQSEAHFSRAFRRTFGEPPRAFVIRRRLELAADYMVQTDESLSTIALRCGFADQPHLCRAFRKAVGLSPALWRRTRGAYVEEDNSGTPAGERLIDRRQVA